MSRRRIFASVAGAAIASSACMAYPNNPWFEQRQSPAPQLAPTSGVDEVTPAVTQAGAQQEEGPRVSIYAEVMNSAGTRLVRANFHLDDDAYVLVGHIDADGVLRIEFPDTPLDFGLVKGHASYQTAQFFAGFTNQYRARFATGQYRGTQAAGDSYDGGTGYIFVIASWQPLHFEKFSSGGVWDSFEVADADYARDPRPAVYELAASLAGTNPSTYTVRFASAYDTYTPYAATSAFADSYYGDGFGSQMCSGFGYGYSAGFPSSPFTFSGLNPVLTYGYGQSFWWRGSQYLYSAAGDCYYSGGSVPYGGYRPYVYGWTIAQTPTAPPPSTGRLIGIDRIRTPVTPQATPMHLAPGGGSDVGSGAGNATHLSSTPEPTTPEYRTRGLVAHQDPAGTDDHIAPRSYGGNRAHDGGSQSGNNQGMVIRNGNDGRAQTTNSRGDGSNNNAARAQTQNQGQHAVPQTRNESHADAPRVAPAQSPHFDAPRSAPPPTPHVDAPRMAPAPPPPSSSSSSGKPPSSKN